VRNLKALKVPDWSALQLGRSQKGYWFMSGPPLNYAMNRAFWKGQGFISLVELLAAAPV
jgi:hypothetical protein